MKKINTRVAAGVGLAGAAVMGLTSLGAGGAAAGPLPGGYVSKTLVDGTPVTVRLFDENVTVNKALVSSALDRQVWASGKVKVTVGGEAEGGTIAAGYIVGCQVHIGVGGGVGGGIAGGYDFGDTAAPGDEYAPGGPSFGWDDDGYGAPGASGSFTLGPGQAGYVPLIQETDDDDDAVNDYTFSGRSGGVAYSQETFKISECAGFAEAKAKVTVTVDTAAVKGVVTLYGKPFSLG
ncbi:MspA family porin [Gordonia tangerina]|uniref:MspA family porin n=1 Tax=Gordonia tangerina TaxID=2911060 RepID=A0ABS9DP26_9ACTN|nr:MspA family porin [Gordonia tangerina]MCF3939975.1 MspA family porin [Gordonia tangerina]